MRGTLWDPRTYVQHRHDRAWLADHVYPGIPKVTRDNGHDWIYTLDLPDRHFLQLTEDDSTLHPWPIAIVANGGLVSHGHHSNEISNHGGVATPSHVMGYWFTRQTDLYKRAVEPEALYRGVLYGATLAILALTSDARMGELVQVSAPSLPRVTCHSPSWTAWWWRGQRQVRLA